MAEAGLPSVDWLRKRLEEADPDLLRAMVETVVATLMGAEADPCAGPPMVPDTLSGPIAATAIPLHIPKLRQGSYFPDWLLEPPAPRREGDRAGRC